jgi:hypothetical protein
VLNLRGQPAAGDNQVKWRRLIRDVNESLRASGDLTRIAAVHDTLWKAEENFTLTAQGLGPHIQEPINSMILLGEVWGAQVELEMLLLASRMIEPGASIWREGLNLGAET